MSGLNFSGGWATVPGSSVRNLDNLRVSQTATVGVWHKLPDGRWSAVNVYADGSAPVQVFGRTKDECRQKLRALRKDAA